MKDPRELIYQIQQLTKASQLELAAAMLADEPPAAQDCERADWRSQVALAQRRLQNVEGSLRLAHRALSRYATYEDSDPLWMRQQE